MAIKPDKVLPNDPLGVQAIDAKPASPKASTPTNSSAKPSIRVKQQLTLPLISMAHRDILLCQVLSEPSPADFELGPSNEKPPMLCRVLDYDIPGEALLICNALVISAFDRAQGKLTGRYFKLVSGEMKEGKQFKYRDIRIDEMEITNE